MPRLLVVEAPDGRRLLVEAPDAPTASERLSEATSPPAPSFARRAATFGVRVAPPVVGGLLAGPGGAFAGGLAGEALAQAIEKGAGEREEINPLSVAVAGAAAAVPIAKLKAATPLLTRIAARAVQGAGEAGVAGLATDIAEGRGVQPRAFAERAVAGAVLGGAGGGLEARSLRSAKAGAVAVSEPTLVKQAIRSDSREIARLRQGISRLERDVAGGVGTPGMPDYIAQQKTKLEGIERRLTANRDRLRQLVPVQTPSQEVGPGSAIQRAVQKAAFGTEETARPADLAPIEVKAADYTAGQVVTKDDFVRRNPDVSDDFTIRFDEGNARRVSAERVDAVFGDLHPTNRELVKEVVRRNASLIDEAARGRISDETRGVMASRLAPVLGKKLAQGEILSSEAQLAARDYAARLADDVLKLTDERANAILRGEPAEDLASAITQKHNDLGLLITGVYSSASEAGRTLRANRGVLTPELAAGRAARRLIRDVRKTGGVPKVSADDLTAALLLQRSARGPDEQRAANEAFAHILMDLTRPTPAQRFSSILKGSLLLRIGSNVRNTISGAYNLGEQFLALPFQVGADVARAARTGAPREVFLHEYKGLLAGVWLGAQEAASMLRLGLRHSDFDSSTALVERIQKGGLQAAVRSELSPGEAALTFRNPALQAATTPLRFSGKILEATDTFFRSINANVQRQRMAISQAKREGARGARLIERVADIASRPSREISAASEALAARGTFQEVPDWATNSVQNWKGELARKQGFIPGTVSAAVDLTLPFVRTPGNILRRGMLFTPGIGHALSKRESARLLRSASGGSPTIKAALANRFESEIAGEVWLGTALLAPLVMLAASGRVTGAPPSNPIDRDLFYREGKIPNAVRIGDTWVKLATVAPQLSLPAAVVANSLEMYEQARREGFQPDVRDLTAGVAMQMGWSALDASYFEGLNRLATGLAQAGKSGDLRASSNVIGGLVSESIGSLVPGIVGEVGTALDPVVRDPRNVPEAVKRSLPFLSESVPARITARGEPATKFSAIPGFGDITVAQPADRLDAVLGRLRDLGEDVGTSPPRDVRSVKIPDPEYGGMRDVRLAPEEALAVNTMVARLATRFMSQAIDMDGFDTLKPSQQARVLNRAKDKAQTAIGRMTQALVAQGQPLTADSFARLVQ